MALPQAVLIGYSANRLSKILTGHNETSIGRSAVSTGLGVAGGAITSGTLVIAGAASAPVTIPIAVAGGIMGLIASLFD